MKIERLRWLLANEDQLRQHGLSRDEVDVMTKRNAVAEQPAEPAAPQLWRTFEGAQWWRVIGVGKRHPRWLEFEIATIAARYDPLGMRGQGTLADEYRPIVRIVAQQLRELDPAAATGEDVSRQTHNAFARVHTGRPVGEEPAYRAMAEEVLAAWRAYAARMAQTAAPSPPLRAHALRRCPTGSINRRPQVTPSAGARAGRSR